MPVTIELGSTVTARRRVPTPQRHEPSDPRRTQRRSLDALSASALPGLPFPDYTFEAFVAGPCNRFAHAAAMAVAEAPPSKAYNPLFIYGGVGLGKTHLLSRSATTCTGLAPACVCKYVTSEQFVTEFIKAVRERQGYQFRRATATSTCCWSTTSSSWPSARRPRPSSSTRSTPARGRQQIVIASDRPPHELSAWRNASSAGSGGGLRRRAASRPRDAHRDPAAQGPARPHPRADDVIEFIAHVRPEHPRARGRARPRGRLGRADRAADRQASSPSRRSRTSSRRPRRDPARPDPRGDGARYFGLSAGT